LPGALSGQIGGAKVPIVTIRGTFYKDRTLPSLNDYIAEIGRNPKAGGRFKADYMKPCISAIRKCLRGWKVTNPPINIHYVFHEPMKGIARDHGNIFSFCDKVFEDALQAAGVIENDNPKWVDGLGMTFKYTTGEPFIEILIEEGRKADEDTE
jgi:hypothetical protein